jgi:hypothetical protein
MKYYLLLILLLMIGCGPSDPELNLIWRKNQAIVLTNGTNNITFIPETSLFTLAWRRGWGQDVDTSVLYSIKGKNSNDLYTLRQFDWGVQKNHYPDTDIYEIIKVYSESVEW